jgi:hypothetical protein
MDIEIIQKQDKKLLTEHAISSFNFTWLGRNEWLMAIIFLILGIFVTFFIEKIRLSGFVGIAIGVIELIKFPNRIKRWVNRKTKEKIFNKEVKFVLKDWHLEVLCDGFKKNHSFKNMRQCLISKTGFLFKISYTEYYYISFESLEKNTMIDEIIEFLKLRFEPKRIKIRLN